MVTFDHEQVDLALLAALEADGAPGPPGGVALALAVDKAEMRRPVGGRRHPRPGLRRARRGRPGAGGTTGGQVEAFAAERGWPLVLKAARGGYDGKGVWPVDDLAQAREVCRRAGAAGTPLLVEELVALDAELAVLVARRPGGQVATWPAVETAQVDGVCREVLVPGRLAADVAGVAEAADALARRVAEVVGSVGVLAVELFWSGGRLLVNEVAARPHNSGHWTIEGAGTSQFENHLRAVLDLPLGTTGAGGRPRGQRQRLRGRPTAADPGRRLAGALAVGGAHVHLYGKGARPGRKLGHVTVCGRQRPGCASGPGPRRGPWARRTRPASTPERDAEGRRERRRRPLVAVVMGSSSDLAVMQAAVDMLEQFGVPHEVRVVSAAPHPRRHAGLRPPGGRTRAAGHRRRRRGARPPAGMLASVTTLPVIGVPVALATLDGMDSLLSIVQMPRGVPWPRWR